MTVNRISRLRFTKSTRGSYHNNRHRSQSQARSQSRHNMVSRQESKHVTRGFDPALLKSLNLENCCLACGKRDSHDRKDCRVKEKLFCTACKRYQHLAKVCVTTLSKQLNTKKKDNSVKSLMTDDDLSEYEYDTNQIMIYQINHQLNSKLSDKIFVNVLLSGET